MCAWQSVAPGGGRYDGIRVARSGPGQVGSGSATMHGVAPSGSPNPLGVPAREINASGIPLQASYDGPATERTPPGTFPFTRGIRKDMYRGRHWTMRQYAGFASAAESNARYRYLLDRGVSGLSVAFDLPTQLGYDSDAR